MNQSIPNVGECHQALLISVLKMVFGQYVLVVWPYWYWLIHSHFPNLLPLPKCCAPFHPGPFLDLLLAQQLKS